MSTTRTLGSDICSESHLVVTKISGIVYPRSATGIMGLFSMCNAGDRSFLVDMFNLRVIVFGRCYQLLLWVLDKLGQNLIIRDKFSLSLKVIKT